MPGKHIVEPFVALIIVFLLIALATMILQELIAAMINWRGRFLQKNLRVLLGDETLYRSILSHPTISLQRGAPSFISPEGFALAVIDVLAGSAESPKAYQALRISADNLPRSPAKVALRAIFRDDATDLAKIDERIQRWFNGATEQISAKYMLRARIMSFGVGCLLAIIFQLDALSLLRNLWLDPTGASIMQAHLGANPNITVGGYIPPSWWEYLLGCLITALAASIAAPMWFDFLQKFLTLRSDPKDAAADTSSASSLLGKLSSSSNSISPALVALGAGAIAVTGTLALAPGGQVSLEPATVKIDPSDLRNLSDAFRVKLDPVVMKLDPSDIERGVPLKADGIKFPPLNAVVTLPANPAVSVKVDGIDVKALNGQLQQINTNITTMDGHITGMDRDITNINPQMTGRGGVAAGAR